MDGWKTFSFPFGAKGLFSGGKLAVSFRVPGINWVVPPPRMPVTSEGLGWDPLITKYIIFLVVTIASWARGQPKVSKSCQTNETLPKNQCTLVSCFFLRGLVSGCLTSQAYCWDLRLRKQ